MVCQEVSVQRTRVSGLRGVRVSVVGTVVPLDVITGYFMGC